jgi:hypothetical protein
MIRAMNRSLVIVATLVALGARAGGQEASFADDAALVRALAPREVAAPARAFATVGADAAGGWAVEAARSAGATVWLWRWDDASGDARVAVPDGYHVLAVAPDRRALVIDVHRAAALIRVRDGARVEQPLARAHAAAFGGEGDRLLLGGADGALLLRLATDASVAAVVSLGVGDVRAVALADRVDRAALVDGEGRIHVVDVQGDAPAPRAVLPAAETEAERATAVALTPDGRLALTGHNDTRVVLWDLSGVPRVAASIIVDEGGLPMTAVALSADGRRGACTSLSRHELLRLDPEGGAIRVSRTEFAPVSVLWPAPGATPAGGDLGLLTVRATGGPRYRFVARWSPPTGTLRVGDDTLTWPPPVDARLAPRGAPWLTARASWTAGLVGDEGPVTLEVDVHNVGLEPATWLVATLDAAPAGAVVAPPIHLGSIAAGQGVRRTIRLPRTPALARGDVQLTLRFSDPSDVTPPPVTWQHLPRTAGDGAAFDALARRIHDATVQVLREALADPTFAPALERLPDGAIGFFTGRAADGGSVLRYQSPFRFGPTGYDGNRRATGAEDAQEVVRDAELMLWWYLPHEAVHAARRHTGRDSGDPWKEEWTAAALQPALAARVLERAGAPYELTSVLAAVERWATRLGRSYSPERRARVEDFVASAGATAPDDDPASEVFARDVGFYVYLLSRTSLGVHSRGAPLETLVGQHLAR